MMATSRQGHGCGGKPVEIEVMLEKLNASRLGGADLYDWDELASTA
jgi:hypothetical protein